MKKYSKYVVVAMSALSLAFSTGTMLKVNATPATTSAVPAQPVDLTYAAEKSLPSVVHILSTKNSKVQTVEVESDPFSDFFGDPFGFFGNPQGNGGKQKRSVRTPKQQGSGSGVIISADGYIVTNNHVVADADELTVTLNDNKEYSARIIGTDKTTDLALTCHHHRQQREHKGGRMGAGSRQPLQPYKYRNGWHRQRQGSFAL